MLVAESRMISLALRNGAAGSWVVEWLPGACKPSKWVLRPMRVGFRIEPSHDRGFLNRGKQRWK